MNTLHIPKAADQSLTQSQVADLRLAALKMHGAERRSFQAEITMKYCEGRARLAETIFGWGRAAIRTGLAEKRTGIVCLSAQSAFSGNKPWEVKQPQAAEALRQLAESHAQQDPTFRTSMAYTRLTAKEALRQLREQGFSDAQLPAPSTMANILNRFGYRLRKVLKAKPQKKSQKQKLYSIISKIKIRDTRQRPSSD